MGENIVVSKYYTDSIWKDNFADELSKEGSYSLKEIMNIFPMVLVDQVVSLGEFDDEKGGYYGDYSAAHTDFEVFMPRDYSNQSYFSKNGMALLIQPEGVNIEASIPVVEQNRLIYDEVYKQTSLVREFNENGIKDYIFLKGLSAPDSYFYKLNYYGGKIDQIGDKIVFLGDMDEEKFVIEPLKVFDASGKQIVNGAEYILHEDDILELKVNVDERYSYPVMIDPSIKDINND